MTIATVVVFLLLQRRHENGENDRFLFLNRGPSPQHPVEAPGAVVLGGGVSVQVVESSLSSGPLSSQARLRPLSRSFSSGCCGRGYRQSPCKANTPRFRHCQCWKWISFVRHLQACTYKEIGDKNAVNYSNC